MLTQTLTYLTPTYRVSTIVKSLVWGFISQHGFIEIFNSFKLACVSYHLAKNSIRKITLLKLCYVLVFVADGCADISPSYNTYVHRNGDKLTIFCNTTGDTRHLVCSGTQWIGEIINCTDGTFRL